MSKKINKLLELTLNYYSEKANKKEKLHNKENYTTLLTKDLGFFQEFSDCTRQPLPLESPL